MIDGSPPRNRTDAFIAASVPAVRWLLGIQCLLSGLNWWYKVLPFPNMFDPPGMPVKSEIVGVMIHSGWMFTAAKAIELALGLALLFNRFVPLMLVVAFPVLLMTFMLDALIGSTVMGWLGGNVPIQHLWAKLLDATFFGGAVIVMQVFLMLAYFDHYRPMLAFKARPDVGPDVGEAS
jgi:hypothetical protein